MCIDKYDYYLDIFSPSDRQTVPLSEVAMQVALRVSLESSARSPKYAPVLTAGEKEEREYEVDQSTPHSR